MSSRAKVHNMEVAQLHISRRVLCSISQVYSRTFGVVCHKSNTMLIGNCKSVSMNMEEGRLEKSGLMETFLCSMLTFSQNWLWKIANRTGWNG